MKNTQQRMRTGGQSSLTEAYRNAADRILAAAMADEEGWEKLAVLTTEIGPRLSGSPQLERAIEWAHRRMMDEHLDGVRLQPIKVPHWVRGQESAEILAPERRPLRILGLGGSVPTPPDGITAPVIVVKRMDDFAALKTADVEGRILVYALDWENYGVNARCRVAGASDAAELGAVAALVRSVTDQGTTSLHTGGMGYRDGIPKIPTAAISVEDTMWLRELAASDGEIQIKITMGCQTLPDADSANVIAEITGSEKPEEVVVIGGHYDCWDVGHGAHDDGAACMAAWQALRIIRQLGLRPRRTLRVVFWTNEENGLRGGLGYRDALGDDVINHVAALEMDGGCERPVNFGLGLHDVDPNSGNPRYEAAYEKMCRIGKLLESIGADKVVRGGSAADIRPLMRAGVPGLRLNSEGGHYLKWHHADTDRLDQVEPENVCRAIALFGVFGYVLADMPDRLVPAGWASGQGEPGGPVKTAPS